TCWRTCSSRALARPRARNRYFDSGAGTEPAGAAEVPSAGADCVSESDLLPVTFFAVSVTAWPAAVASSPMPFAVLHAPTAKGRTRIMPNVHNFIAVSCQQTPDVQ